jgi:C4-dicarboxylate-specific signal transduction histidine kinase
MMLCYIIIVVAVTVAIYSSLKYIGLKKTVVEKDKLLIRQAKLASIGEMLEHIAHQWKQPLAQINSVVLNIESNYEDGKLSRKILDDELSQIENLTHFMSQTIESFRNYLHPDKEKTTFSIKEVTDETLSLIKPLLKHKKIECNVDIKDNEMIRGYKKEFVQTLLVLLNNSKDALLENSIKEPFVKISSYKKDSHTVISVCDNGGGIDAKIMDRIFDPYFTTKQKSKGTGHGLSMAKMIIEESFKGTIKAINTKDGVCFEIEV